MISSKDPGKGHFYVSIVKSVIRIGAGGCIVKFGYDFQAVDLLMYAGLLIIAAEVLGIVEEVV